MGRTDVDGDVNMLDFLKGKGDENEPQTKATDRLGYMDATLPNWERVGYNTQRSRNYSALMQRFDGWVYAAAMTNARGVASQSLKLYSTRPTNGAKSVAPTREVGTTKSAYLQGKMESRPSPFVQRKAMTGEVVEVVDHPILDLLENPSPEMDGYTLTMLRMLNLQLTGNAYLHPIVSETLGVPIELWNMASNLVTIVPDGELDMVEGYQYGQLPNITDFRKEEVLHERQPNPIDPLYGKGWVSAAIEAIDLLQAMDEYEQNVLDNQARPDWAVMVKEHLTDTQYQRLYQQIEKQLRGKSNRSKPFIFEGGTSGVPMSFSPADLQFATGENRKVEVIAAISGVPVTKLKANDPNLANAREGNLGWLRDTIVPYLVLDESFINRQLVPMFGAFADTLFVAYDDPVQQDKSQQATIDASDAAAGIRTRNEIRSDRGLEPVEGGDELLIPAGSVPIEVAIEQARNPQPMFGAFAAEPPEAKAEECQDGFHWMPPDDEHPEGRCMEGETHSTYSVEKANGCVGEKIPQLIAEGYPKNQAIAIAYSMCGLAVPEGLGETKSHEDCGCNESKTLEVSIKSLFERSRSLVGKRAPVDTGNAEWEATMSRYASPMDKFKDSIVDVFETEILRFIDQGMGTDASIIGTLDKDSSARLEQASRDFVKDVTMESGQRELDSLGVGFEFNPLSPSVMNFLDNYTVDLTETLTRGTVREVQSKIDLGIRHGASTDEIAQGIESLLKEEPKTGKIPIRMRAEMIARTEVAMIPEGARLEAWRESGVVTMKQWQVSAGACAICRWLASAQPDPIPLNDSFIGGGRTISAGGLNYTTWKDVQNAPLHPNCRCGTVQILGDETKEEIEYLKEHAEKV